ncbi:HAD-IIIC family phosphatase [Alphaproteobacteria bacterium]|nr:HAD-IIIC family phosphatase [Alphaproteobacteria bacterium]
MLNYFELQDFLFQNNPSRLDLVSYVPAKLERSFKVSIVRNHSFELIEKSMAPFLDFAGLSISFFYSDYDDTLSFDNFDDSSDIAVLWLDLERYNFPDINSFLEQRIEALLVKFDGDIIVATIGGDFSIDEPRVKTYDLMSWKNVYDEDFIDERLEKVTGTRLGVKASLSVTKDLGLKWFPAMLFPTLKCIVVDLDNTLYQGIIGEDGFDGVVLTEGHMKLQSRLRELSQMGFFLCIASKNDERDVLELFKERPDFPLKIGDFSKICANWDAKTKSIEDISNALNIHPSSFLFIDDNLGELHSVNNAYPSVKLIWAKDNAAVTSQVLENYPGLMRLTSQSEDGLRSKDIKANEERNKLLESVGQVEYIKSLDMELSFSLNNKLQTSRVAELANKTNQFIFNYRRYSHADIERIMTDPEVSLVTVSLSDKLSDSGLIGTLVCRLLSGGGMVAAQLDECFVSCRALGRGIDEAIVLGAIDVALKDLGVDKLVVQFQNGERNLPAKNFVETHFHEHLNSASEFKFDFPSHLIKSKILKANHEH